MIGHALNGVVHEERMVLGREGRLGHCVLASSSESTLSMKGKRAGSAMVAAMLGGSMRGASRKEACWSIKPSEPQPRTRRLPPRKASPTKRETPSSHRERLNPSGRKDRLNGPASAIPTSRQPVHPMATARQFVVAVRRAISASSTELAAA